MASDRAYSLPGKHQSCDSGHIEMCLYAAYLRPSWYKPKANLGSGGLTSEKNRRVPPPVVLRLRMRCVTGANHYDRLYRFQDRCIKCRSEEHTSELQSHSFIS